MNDDFHYVIWRKEGDKDICEAAFTDRFHADMLFDSIIDNDPSWRGKMTYRKINMRKN